MNRQDDLATESQKLAAYNMMVFMTQGTMNNKDNPGLAGIPINQEGGRAKRNTTEDSVLPEVQDELDAEDRRAESNSISDGGDQWIDKLTSAPLMDQNNQFLSFDDKLSVYKKLFDELDELHKESADLDSSDDEEEAKERADAERIVAAKKKKEANIRSHLAFLHHEDFIQQLGEEIHGPRKEAAPVQEAVKMEPQDEDTVYFGSHRSRFAEELENLVPDAIIDLSNEPDEPNDNDDNNDSDEDYYDPKRDRHAKVNTHFINL